MITKYNERHYTILNDVFHNPNVVYFDNEWLYDDNLVKIVDYIYYKNDPSAKPVRYKMKFTFKGLWVLFQLERIYDK